MPRPERTAARVAFAERLAELCADMGLPERGRQTQLAKQFGVSQPAARKWLDGVSYPETETIVAIADWASVNVNWLLQGTGPKRGNRVDTKALLLDEAVRALPRESALDLIDSVRSKLQRIGKLKTSEPTARYGHMLDAYEEEFLKQKAGGPQ